MSHHRNSPEAHPVTERAGNAVPDGQLLDGAYALLLDVGMRRLSMADIARRAGVSRATLYRRWSNVEAVIGALVTREFGALDAQFDVAQLTDRARLVRSVVAVTRAVRGHPVLRKIVEVDPEFLLPYLLERPGSSTRAQLDTLQRALRAGQRTGAVRTGRPAALARAVWLTAMAFTLSGPVLADRTVSLRALDDQLGQLLDRYLAP